MGAVGLVHGPDWVHRPALHARSLMHPGSWSGWPGVLDWLHQDHTVYGACSSTSAYTGPSVGPGVARACARCCEVGSTCSAFLGSLLWDHVAPAVGQIRYVMEWHVSCSGCSRTCMGLGTGCDTILKQLGWALYEAHGAIRCTPCAACSSWAARGWDDRAPWTGSSLQSISLTPLL